MRGGEEGMAKKLDQHLEEVLGRTLTPEEDDRLEAFKRGLIVALHFNDSTRATPEEVELARGIVENLFPEFKKI